MALPKLVIVKLSGYTELLGINPRDGKAMYELQLELHTRANGSRPIISADELLDLHLLLAQEPDLDFKRLLKTKP